jgi:hypothetical protein
LSPSFFQHYGVLRNDLLGAPHVAIGNGTDDPHHLRRPEVDLQSGAGLLNVYMWRRMVERIDPHLKASLAQNRWHVQNT